MERAIEAICDEHPRLHFVDNRIVAGTVCTALWAATLVTVYDDPRDERRLAFNRTVDCACPTCEQLPISPLYGPASWLDGVFSAIVLLCWSVVAVTSTRRKAGEASTPQVGYFAGVAGCVYTAGTLWMRGMVDRLQDWQKVCERTGGTFEQNQCSGANIKRGCVKSAAICALLGRTWSNETCA